MDVLHKFLKFVDHQRGLVIALVFGLLVIGIFNGCQPKTISLIDPSAKVTAAQLERERQAIVHGLEEDKMQLALAEDRYNAKVVAHNGALDGAQADLAQQAEFRLQLIEWVGGLATTVVSGAINPAQGVAAGLNLLTLLAAGGLGYDSLRKNKVIKEAKAS